MAKIGVKRQMIAPITSSVDGSPVVYGPGREVTGGSGLAAVNISWNYGDQTLYLDDKLAESDRPLSGGTVTPTVGGLMDDLRKLMLGDMEDSGGGSGPKDLIRTDANPPLVGYGFIRCLVMSGVKQYQGVWLYKVQFTQPSDNATTRGETISYETTDLDGTIMGVVVDDSGTVRYQATQTFDTEAAAVTWLKAKANITANEGEGNA